jgi:hypothetical protein
MSRWSVPCWPSVAGLPPNTSWTIESMLNWNYSLPNMLEVRFETVMSEFDATFQKLFESFGFSG